VTTSATIQRAMADLCTAHKGLDDAVGLRGQPHLQSAVLLRVAAGLKEVQKRIEYEGERLRTKRPRIQSRRQTT